ncbi:NADH dehydrogenase [ubiquinone] 1 alpha subcomplex assembly factor 2 isoform X1 [Maylandia zebra]|uniref:NADH:ubiquinone oxidoreductase complex assembly factor 2 n=2 Tax=Astatotilapia calliptera TaxID=8154 RepID=A0AAX7SXF1_ASTCA|nr:NADH dehydrogenase [ubiquinone] 1 alpha subcomplex assembly factor 2 isoform X1 [Astatotilapia calliptera]
MFHFIAVQEQRLPTEGDSPYQTDTPPPNTYVMGGSVVFHKYMYILYLLFKCGDKGCGGRAAKSNKTRGQPCWSVMESKGGGCNPVKSDGDRERQRRIVRAKRIVEAANAKEYEYMEGSIPMEWDAWIRGRRKEPPSIEELLKNESNREQIKTKAKEVEEKDRALLAKEYKEGLVATPARTVAKGHAAATSFDKQEFNEEPTSTANTFQPGSWMPTSKKD